MEDIKKEVIVEPVKVEAPVADPLTEKDVLISKLTEERDNYKTVALARKGKLPADNELLGEDFDEMIKAKVQEAMVDKEINRTVLEKQAETARILRENAELKLLIKNQPLSGLGGSGSGPSQEVKDNVFSTQQIEVLKAKAIQLKTDPDKYVERAKSNFLRNA